MMRIQLTKKQRQTERRVAVDSTLNSLLSFGDYNVEETMAHSVRLYFLMFTFIFLISWQFLIPF